MNGYCYLLSHFIVKTSLLNFLNNNATFYTYVTIQIPPEEYASALCCYRNKNSCLSYFLFDLPPN